jgi:hypothetical protein
MKHIKSIVLSSVVCLLSLASAAQAGVHPGAQCRTMAGGAFATGSGSLENPGATPSNVLCPAPRAAGVNFAAGSTVTVVDPDPGVDARCQLHGVIGNAAGGYAVFSTPTVSTAGFANTWTTLTFPALAVPFFAHAVFACQLPSAGAGVSAKLLNYMTP